MMKAAESRRQNSGRITPPKRALLLLYDSLAERPESGLPKRRTRGQPPRDDRLAFHAAAWQGLGHSYREIGAAIKAYLKLTASERAEALRMEGKPWAALVQAAEAERAKGRRTEFATHYLRGQAKDYIVQGRAKQADIKDLSRREALEEQMLRSVEERLERLRWHLTWTLEEFIRQEHRICPPLAG